MEYHIAANTEVAPGYGSLTLDLPENAASPRPGQFYGIRCGTGTAPLIRRPISMHRMAASEGARRVELLYHVVGQGTEWLLSRRNGQALDALGPFGNGFRTEGIQQAVLVAGGIGLAPLYAAGEAVRNGTGATGVTVIMGARNKEGLFYEEQCGNLGEAFFSTEDGSFGFRGTSLDLLGDLLQRGRVAKEATFFACGPGPMLKALAGVAAEHELSVQVSLEEYMCCGFGACLSCAFPLRPGQIRRDREWPKTYLQWSEDGKAAYALVCKDGPVFDINEVEWDEWLA